MPFAQIEGPRIPTSEITGSGTVNRLRRRPAEQKTHPINRTRNHGHAVPRQLQARHNIMSQSHRYIAATDLELHTRDGTLCK